MSTNDEQDPQYILATFVHWMRGGFHSGRVANQIAQLAEERRPMVDQAELDARNQRNERSWAALALAMVSVGGLDDFFPKDITEGEIDAQRELAKALLAKAHAAHAARYPAVYAAQESPVQP